MGRPVPATVVDPTLPIAQRRLIPYALGPDGAAPSRVCFTRRVVELLRPRAVIGAAGLILLIVSIPAGPGLAHVLAIVGVLLVAVTVAPALAALPQETRRRAEERILHQAAGRYVTAGELDEPSREMLGTVQRAIGTVLSSEVHRAGALDSAHEGLLADVEWRIAVRLRQLTRLRAGDYAGHQTAGAALDRADRDVRRQAAALERYAEQVAAADIAYQMAGDDDRALADLDSLTALAAGLARQPDT